MTIRWNATIAYNNEYHTSFWNSTHDSSLSDRSTWIFCQGHPEFLLLRHWKFLLGDSNDRPTFCLYVVPCSKSVRILGVCIDRPIANWLNSNKYVTNVVQSCNYHTRSLHHIRSLFHKDAATILAFSIVSSRLDYCNVVLYGITSKKNADRYSASRFHLREWCAMYRIRRSSQPYTALHWLSIEPRIQYKIAVVSYKVRLHQQPQHLCELVNDQRLYLPARSLRSSNNALLIVPSTKTVTDARAFRVGYNSPIDKLE